MPSDVPYQDASSPSCISMASPKSANFTDESLALLARSRFSGCWRVCADIVHTRQSTNTRQGFLPSNLCEWCSFYGSKQCCLTLAVYNSCRHIQSWICKCRIQYFKSPCISLTVELTSNNLIKEFTSSDTKQGSMELWLDLLLRNLISGNSQVKHQIMSEVFRNDIMKLDCKYRKTL